MAMPFRQAIDLSQNELRNAKLQNLSGAPSSPVLGQLYYNTVSNVAFVWNGTAWRPFDAAGLTDNSIPISALAINPLNRANHTGVQTSSTISDFSTAVRTNSIDQLTAPGADVSMNNHKLTNLLTAVSAGDATRLDQVQALIAAAQAGQTAIKVPVRVYADANLTLSGIQTVQGVSLAVGDRVAAGAQSTATQNNIYVAASGAWTIAPDCSSAGAWTEGTEFLVAEGTYTGAILRQTTTGGYTPGTTALAFVQTAKINTYTADEATIHLTGSQFSAKLGAGITSDANGIAINTAVVVRKYSAAITGDGSTATFSFTHNLGTTDIMMQMRDTAGNVDYADYQATGANTAAVSFGSPPIVGAGYRVSIFG